MGKLAIGADGCFNAIYIHDRSGECVARYLNMRIVHA
jgi:hypothetical protein